MARPPSPATRPRPEALGWRSRLAAADLVSRCLDGGADLDSAMLASSPFARLDGPDRGFARAMAGAALRGVGRIDWALGGMIERPMDQLQPEVRALLRIGAAQLWRLAVADHAAVSATVEAAARWPAAARGGALVNAVLRRAAREASAFAAAPPMSVWPEWMAARLSSALGPDRAAAMAEAQLDEPPTVVTLRLGRDPAEWAARLGGEVLPGGSIRLAAAAGISILPGYADGEWWVQDAAAAIPARLMGDVAGRAVADLCAAPGGKALQLADAGARVSAIEISQQRAARLKENATRTGLALDIVVADARTWRPDAPLDAVLLDAPCSALGVMRRHPEGVWRRDPKDLARFPAIQRSLLGAAAAMLRSGGRLVYSVCTPLPEEGVEVVNAAVASGAWRRVPIGAGEVTGFDGALTAEGDLLTAPRRGAEAALPSNPDVFYIARLERV